MSRREEGQGVGEGGRGERSKESTERDSTVGGGSERSHAGASAAGRPPRVWVSVHFRCCNIYQRVYFPVGAEQTVGRCPSCLNEIRFRLDDQAEPGRFFAAEP